MKDNPVKKVSDAARSVWGHTTKKLRWELDLLSPRQRLYLVLGLVALFVVVDVVYIVGGFKGDAKAGPQIEHLQQLSVEPENQIEHDSIP